MGDVKMGVVFKSRNGLKYYFGLNENGSPNFSIFNYGWIVLPY
jgi:hypothetical protein